LAVGSWQLAVGSWQLAVGSLQFAKKLPTENCRLRTFFDFESLNNFGNFAVDLNQVGCYPVYCKMVTYNLKDDGDNS